MKVMIEADAPHRDGRPTACAGADPGPEQDDACPEDPDGVHFVGCGCDYTCPDDPEPEAAPEPDPETALVERPVTETDAAAAAAP